VVDAALVALAAQHVGRREPGGAGADDAHGLRTLPARPGRLHPAELPGAVRDELLDRADGDRFEALLDDAVALAQPVLRADAAAHLGKGVGCRAELVRLLQPALGRELQPVRAVVVPLTADLTERHAALRAPRGLLGRLFRGVATVDFAEILHAAVGRTLFGEGLRNGHELQHALGHGVPFPRNFDVSLY